MLKQIKYIFFFIILTIFCSKNDNYEPHIKSSNKAIFFSKTITIIKDAINVRDKIYPKNKSKIIDKVIKKESFYVIDIIPRSIYIYQDLREGWIFINKTNHIKFTNNHIFLKRNFNIYNNVYKSNIIGIARKGAIYEIKKILPLYIKIKLDNNKEGWIYAGNIKNPWVKEIKDLVIIRKDYLNRKLILWNKLGTIEEIKNSEVGSPGNITGDAKFKKGKFGNGFYCSLDKGNDADYITFSATAMTDWSKFTMEAWFKSEWDFVGGQGPSDNCHHCFFSVNSPYSEDNLIHLEAYTGGILTFEIRGDKWLKTAQTKNISWNAGENHHIAIVYDKYGINGTEDKMRIYFDGRIIAKGSEESTINSNVDIMIGNWLAYNPDYPNQNKKDGALIDRPFHGVIDNFKIYNYAKTDFSDNLTE